MLDEGTTNANAGFTVTETAPVAPLMVTIADPLLEVSAWLVAVTGSGFTAGTLAGARKSTPPALAALGAAHGFDPLTQICPTLAFPFTTPATDHVTAVSEVPATAAENDVRCSVPIVAVGGATFTVTPLVIVTVAAAISGPPAGCGATVAWIVTGFVAGRSVGAV
jgi:hypothetical protein